MPKFIKPREERYHPGRSPPKLVKVECEVCGADLVDKHCPFCEDYLPKVKRRDTD